MIGLSFLKFVLAYLCILNTTNFTNKTSFLMSFMLISKTSDLVWEKKIVKLLQVTIF